MLVAGVSQVYKKLIKTCVARIKFPSVLYCDTESSYHSRHEIPIETLLHFAH